MVEDRHRIHHRHKETRLVGGSGPVGESRASGRPRALDAPQNQAPSVPCDDL
jgi:hypothetical protein